MLFAGSLLIGLLGVPTAQAQTQVNLPPIKLGTGIFGCSDFEDAMLYYYQETCTNNASLYSSCQLDNGCTTAYIHYILNSDPNTEYWQEYIYAGPKG
jgi:hypothetical protein